MAWGNNAKKAESGVGGVRFKLGHLVDLQAGAPGLETEGREGVSHSDIWGRMFQAGALVSPWHEVGTGQHASCVPETSQMPRQLIWNE